MVDRSRKRSAGKEENKCRIGGREVVERRRKRIKERRKKRSDGKEGRGEV